KESIKLNPNMAEPYYGLGFSNFRLGRFRDAADAFRKAINLSPRMAKAHYGLSLAYQELNNTSGVSRNTRSSNRSIRPWRKGWSRRFHSTTFRAGLCEVAPRSVR